MKQNSKSKLRLAARRRIFPFIAVALLSFAATERVLAQNATGYLFQSGTGATTLNIDRATTSTFQLDLNVMVPFNSFFVVYFFQTGANGSGLFSVIARNTMGTPYTDLTTSDGVAFTPENGLLDPVNNNDLGGATPSISGVPPGLYFVGRLTFSINPDIPFGTYTIFLDYRAEITDTILVDHPLVTNMVTVNIVGTAHSYHWAARSRAKFTVLPAPSILICRLLARPAWNAETRAATTRLSLPSTTT